jgi:voltage-gated potassium channel
MKPITQKNNFYYLTAGLVLMLLVAAVVEHYPGPLASIVIQASTVVMLLAGVYGFRRTRSRFIAGIGFLGIVLVLVLAGMFMDFAGLRYTHLLVLLAFFVWTTRVAARQVLFTGSIDLNKIVGAICIYLLLGLIWALLYLFIAELSPSAFNGFEQAPWTENFFSAIYYSFVTLTTLGYGEITPALPIARFLAFMEAIVGVFYIAILVASLIGVRLSEFQSPGR